VLAEDRVEKLAQIEQQRSRIERLKAQEPAVSGGEWQKERRVVSMQQYLEKLKILADINDPMVKKRFEDGKGTFYPDHQLHAVTILIQQCTPLFPRRNDN